jgi:hypothetical protein
MFSGKEHYMHAHWEMLPIWTLSSCLGQPRQNNSALLTQRTQMLGLCINVAEMALGQHWQNCARNIFCLFFKFTPCSPDQISSAPFPPEQISSQVIWKGNSIDDN